MRGLKIREEEQIKVAACLDWMRIVVIRRRSKSSNANGCWKVERGGEILLRHSSSLVRLRLFSDFVESALGASLRHRWFNLLSDV